ncbi:hypothetical protein E2562_020644 [Oryza meyeriana var. granulata]|uniref:Uncharacterized protein n=1 Tax=Oryza meyeriana var. granulata TaxID=110450 RepID=A0A6G1EB37_9ORYZ|nr:hypothetical protein E2562_020644 [Oryza meyeriana var. granulata]
MASSDLGRLEKRNEAPTTMSSSGRQATTVEKGVGLRVDGDVGDDGAWRWGGGTDGGATATDGVGRRGVAKGSLPIYETPEEKGRKATGGRQRQAVAEDSQTTATATASDGYGLWGSGRAGARRGKRENEARESHLRAQGGGIVVEEAILEREWARLSRRRGSDVPRNAAGVGAWDADRVRGSARRLQGSGGQDGAGRASEAEGRGGGGGLALAAACWRPKSRERRREDEQEGRTQKRREK